MNETKLPTPGVSKEDQTKELVEKICEATGKATARGFELGKAAVESLLKGWTGKKS